MCRKSCYSISYYEWWKEFTAIVVVSNIEEPLPLCGACRQMLTEFVNNEIIVIPHVINTNKIKIWRLSELIPHTFKSNHVKKLLFLLCTSLHGFEPLIREGL